MSIGAVWVPGGKTALRAWMRLKVLMTGPGRSDALSASAIN